MLRSSINILFQSLIIAHPYSTFSFSANDLFLIFQPIFFFSEILLMIKSFFNIAITTEICQLLVIKLFEKKKPNNLKPFWRLAIYIGVKKEAI